MSINLSKFFPISTLPLTSPPNTLYPGQDIDRLKEAGLKSLQLSIDAIDPRLLEFTTGVKDYGRRIVDTFHQLEDAGIQV